MKIERGISANCSEATIRFKTDLLTEKEEKDLYDALESYVKEYDEGSCMTDVTKEKIFGIKCITVKGNAPYNDTDGVIAIVDKFSFKRKIMAETD